MILLTPCEHVRTLSLSEGRSMAPDEVTQWTANKLNHWKPWILMVVLTMAARAPAKGRCSVRESGRRPRGTEKQHPALDGAARRAVACCRRTGWKASPSTKRARSLRSRRSMDRAREAWENRPWSAYCARGCPTGESTAGGRRSGSDSTRRRPGAWPIHYADLTRQRLRPPRKTTSSMNSWRS